MAGKFRSLVRATEDRLAAWHSHLQQQPRFRRLRVQSQLLDRRVAEVEVSVRRHLTAWRIFLISALVACVGSALLLGLPESVIQPGVTSSDSMVIIPDLPDWVGS